MKVRETVWRGDRGGGSVFYRLDAEGRRVSPNLYISYRAGKKEQVVSARTPDAGEARKVLDEYVFNKKAAKKGLDVLRTPKAERLTIMQLLESYLAERDSMRDHARPVIAALGSLKAVDLVPDHIRRFKDLRKAGGIMPATIANELGTLRAAYRFAAGEGRLRFVPIIKPPSFDNARKVFFPLERVPELIKVAAQISPCISDLLAWQSFSGMRPKAIRLLRWSDLDTSDWTLSLDSREDKNKYGRELAIDGESREILDRRRSERQPGDVYIFGGSRAVSHSRLLRVWRLALAQMDLPSGMKDGFVPYDLKKTALRAIRRSGVPEERAMYFSGHRSSRTFRRYDVVASEDNRQDVAKVSEYRKKRFADSRGPNADSSAKLLRIQR